MMQKRPIASNTFKHHGPKAPIINSGCVRLILKELWGLKKEKMLQTSRYKRKATLFLNYYIHDLHKERKSCTLKRQRNNIRLTRYCNVPTKDVHRLPWSTSLAYPRSIILCIVWKIVSIKWLRNLKRKGNNVFIRLWRGWWWRAWALE